MKRKIISEDTSEGFYNSPLVDKKYKDIMRVIDSLFDDIYNGKEWEYLNINLMKKTYMNSIIKRNKEWTKPHSCIYPNCNEQSIKKSHSIQRATSINYISEKGHVLTLTLKENPNTLEYTMESIGINDASTFPGFCEDHEKIFNSFEIDGIFKEDGDYKFQVFRTICREIVSKKHELIFIKESYEDYMEQVQNLFIGKIEEHYGKTVNEIGIKNIKIGRDNNQSKLIEDCIRKFEDTLDKLEELSKSYIRDRIFHINIKIPFQIPVAIAGISNTILFNNEKKIDEDGIIILNCLPFENSTEIIVSCLECYEDSFSKFINYKVQTPLTILNFIESFMVNGTEHWFIKDSIWNMLEDQKKERY